MVIDTGTTSCGGEPEASDSLKGFGAVAKTFRERAGLTQEQLAPLVQYAPHTVASIEQGRRFPPRDFIDRAEEVLDAFGTLRAAARHLSRQPGLAAWFRQWAKLEEQAVSLCTYECRVVPGLLQSEAYTRAVFHCHVPPLTDDEIEARLAARQERQMLLRERPNTAFSFILEEALFLRRVGGVAVTRELVDHVLDCATLRNVEVQVMPLAREEHAALEGPMQLLETPETRWYGYIEGQRTGQLIIDGKEISVLQMRYAKMRSQALTPEDSVGLLERMRGAL
ncbi:helix-turn-helix transcriptional regulator [Streptomyces olivaceiscleroticus]|uniref:Helix-turn-helix transcriptional regulator n=1 Tax=Streptomyces olivaceiscleroticus TaxID=68245 RepID=A0ABP3JMS3_9ACTN